MRSYYRNQDVEECPIPTAQEEREMFEAYRKSPSAALRERIVRSYLRFALRSARKDLKHRPGHMRTRSGLSEDDSISAANLGLMQAIERFDPKKGFRFTTYAGFWVFKQLLEARYAAHSIKISYDETRLFSKFVRMSRKEGLTEEQISEVTGTPLPEVERILALTGGRCVHVGSFINPDALFVNLEPAADVDLTVDGPVNGLEHRERFEQLREAVRSLPKTSRQVVEAKYFSQKSIPEIGRTLGLPNSTVAKILRDAQERLKRKLSHAH